MFTDASLKRARAHALATPRRNHNTSTFSVGSAAGANLPSIKKPYSRLVPLTMETGRYYYGLPSRPVSVARSSTEPWVEPTGPEAYGRPKMLRAVGNHPIKYVWEGNLSRKVVEHLDANKVAWTSVDVVRINYVDEPSFCPVILWIGVEYESLSVEDGTQVACSCREILVESGIIDVEVEIRESRVIPLQGPKLLDSTFYDRIPDVRSPVTPTLGLPISSKLIAGADGTGGLFIAEGGDSKRLFLITARHVVFNTNDNTTFEHDPSSAPSREVIILSDAAFKTYLKFIERAIENNEEMREILGRRIAKGEGEYLEDARMELVKEEREMEDLNTLYGDVSTGWASPDERVLGHVIYSPPIELGFGAEQYTQDFAVIDIDLSKIDATTFEGNVIDIGTKFKIGEFTYEMCHNLQDTGTFEHPWDRLIRLKGTIPDEEKRHPPVLDQNGEPSLMVVKHGSGTGLTVGRANDVRSCVRHRYEDGTTKYSMEWAILPCHHEANAFAGPGDSGAVVADSSGRIGGMITSGAGWTREGDVDITYVTSINSIMQAIKVKFPNAHLDLDLHA